MTTKHRAWAKELEEEVRKALSHYPELKDVGIIFRYRNIIRDSYMLAQPRLRTLILPKSMRQYEIIINKKFFSENEKFENGKPPFDVIVGWIGHELGHVMDYVPRNSLNLMWFGYKYAFRPSFIKKAEITADMNAVKAGMIHYLVVSKEFGRDPQYFAQDYIDKLNGLYPSVEDVKEWDRLHKENLLEFEESKETDPK